MAFNAHVLKVLIASPGDTRAERDAAERALHGWNGDRAEREAVILLPRRWETDAVPRLGGPAQGVINQQLVDDADVVLALFDSRLGMATKEAVSGTAEEIKRADEAGKPVHVWFSEEPLPRDVDIDQLQSLQRFKEGLKPRGLMGSYSSPEDLAYKVRQAIERDLDQLDLGPVRTRRRTDEHAVLRARYDFEREAYSDNKGKVRYRTRRQRLVVRNYGTAVAEEARVELKAPAGEELAVPRLHSTAPARIIPDSEVSWPMLTYAGVASMIEVVMTWMESGDEHSEVQHLSL